jgi:hypothetical protein
MGALSCHSATTLLIRGSKPDPRRVRTGALDHQSQGRRGRAHSSLSSSPPARGRPTCRVREPARAASRGDPIEGELPCPRSLENGTEPHLANPRKRFYGRVSGPRAYPYRTGHGCPLEPPTSSSTRNPQSATRSMGVVETSPSVPRRDDEGAFKTRWRAHPDRLEWAQARGLDARLHLLGCTERERYQSRARDRSRLKHRRRRLKQIPRPLVKIREKTPAGAPTLLQGFGGRPAGSLTRPHGKGLATGREERPISRIQHLREPDGYTHRCSGVTVRDSHKGPLNNHGKTRLKPAKNTNQKSTHAPNTLATQLPLRWPPWPTKVTQLSAPSGEVRLARGLDAVSGEVRLARGLPRAPVPARAHEHLML